MTSTWQYSTSPWLLALAIVFLAASFWFFVRSLKKEGSTRPHFLLHLLRLIIATAVAVTLLHPERVVSLRRTENPRVVVLWDGSGSMETKDVLDEDQRPSTRAGWVKKQVDAEFWKPLEARYQVTPESFSAVTADTKADPETEIGTDLYSPLDRTHKQYGDVRAIILLSDGDWNLSPASDKTPATAAQELAHKQIPIYSIVVGSERFLPDVEVQNVIAPTYGLVNERVSVMVTLQNHLQREVRTTVSIAGPGKVAAQKQVTLPPMAQLQEMLVFQPTEEGEGDFKVSIPVEKEDVFPENNERSFRMAVRKETLKVLLVESQPRWEYRYLRNALMRDPGVSVNSVLYHPDLGMGQGAGYLSEFPAKKEDLQGYDVIFLGDVGVGGGQLTKENAEMIKGLIEQQASGLVFLPGSLGRTKSLLDSPLADLIPVELDYAKGVGFAAGAEAKLDLTFRGRDHWLTMLATDPAANQAVWKGLPGFYWYAPVVKSRLGSEVLAVHEVARNNNGRLPLLVTRTQGNGKVLFMGTDAAWRWRKGVEDTYHYRFWGQVVRWMSHQRHLAQEEGVRFFYTPEAPRRGDRVRLNATVLDKLGIPVNQGKVTITLTAPGGKAETLELANENPEWGVYTGQFIPREGGNYGVEISCPAAERKMKTNLNVTIPALEKVGLPARGDVLRELSNVTGGKFGGTDDLASLVSSISVLPEPRPEEQRFRLWCDPWWCGALLVMLTVYWVGRKLVGLA